MQTIALNVDKTLSKSRLCLQASFLDLQRNLLCSRLLSDPLLSKSIDGGEEGK